MEALLERGGSAIGTPSIQNVWTQAGESASTAVADDPGPSLDWLHRCLNFCLALTALVCVLPILLVIALAVKLSSRGPVFYTQERVGLDRRQRGDGADHRRLRDLGGRPFTIYKFRTMRVDAERESGAVWAQPEDPRVTPVGRLLRQIGRASCRERV